MESDNTALRALLKKLRADLDEEIEDSMKEMATATVFRDAVLALISTHPDPEALLATFQRISPRPRPSSTASGTAGAQERIDAWEGVHDAIARRLPSRR